MGDALSKPANEGLGPSDEVGAVLALRPGIIGTKRKAAEDAAGEVAVKRQQLLGLTMFTLATLRGMAPFVQAPQAGADALGMEQYVQLSRPKEGNQPEGWSAIRALCERGCDVGMEHTEQPQPQQEIADAAECKQTIGSAAPAYCYKACPTDATSGLDPEISSQKPAATPACETDKAAAAAGLSQQQQLDDATAAPECSSILLAPVSAKPISRAQLRQQLRLHSHCSAAAAELPMGQAATTPASATTHTTRGQRLVGLARRQQLHGNAAGAATSAVDLARVELDATPPTESMALPDEPGSLAAGRMLAQRRLTQSPCSLTGHAAADGSACLGSGAAIDVDVQRSLAVAGQMMVAVQPCSPPKTSSVTGSGHNSVPRWTARVPEQKSGSYSQQVHLVAAAAPYCCPPDVASPARKQGADNFPGFWRPNIGNAQHQVEAIAALGAKQDKGHRVRFNVPEPAKPLPDATMPKQPAETMPLVATPAVLPAGNGGKSGNCSITEAKPGRRMPQPPVYSRFGNTAFHRSYPGPQGRHQDPMLFISEGSICCVVPPRPPQHRAAFGTHKLRGILKHTSSLNEEQVAVAADGAASAMLNAPESWLPEQQHHAVATEMELSCPGKVFSAVIASPTALAASSQAAAAGAAASRPWLADTAAPAHDAAASADEQALLSLRPRDLMRGAQFQSAGKVQQLLASVASAKAGSSPCAAPNKLFCTSGRMSRGERLLASLRNCGSSSGAQARPSTGALN